MVETAEGERPENWYMVRLFDNSHTVRGERYPTFGPECSKECLLIAAMRPWQQDQAAIRQWIKDVESEWGQQPTQPVATAFGLGSPEFVSRSVIDRSRPRR